MTRLTNDGSKTTVTPKFKVHWIFVDCTNEFLIKPSLNEQQNLFRKYFYVFYISCFTHTCLHNGVAMREISNEHLLDVALASLLDVFDISHVNIFSLKLDFRDFVVLRLSQVWLQLHFSWKLIYLIKVSEALGIIIYVNWQWFTISYLSPRNNIFISTWKISRCWGR